LEVIVDQTGKEAGWQPASFFLKMLKTLTILKKFLVV
jgi:hypothetical protein